jgi:hypothetical protein
MEAWIEVNLLPRVEPAELLADLVDDAVHGLLREEIETWFFFWEPELRLRIRWSDGSDAEDCRRRLAARLEEAERRGEIEGWYEGAHGTRGERYVGEAEMYGAEAWPSVQKDWMNGSELAVLLAKLERAGSLTRPRRFHWERHVHLYTNQLYGSWHDEIELCLAQALGYLRHVRAGGDAPTPEALRLITELQTTADSAAG